MNSSLAILIDVESRVQKWMPYSLPFVMENQAKMLAGRMFVFKHGVKVVRNLMGTYQVYVWEKVI